MTRPVGMSHGTGWAGVARYVARIRIAARITDRAARITAAAEGDAALIAAQADDLDLLRALDREEDQPRVRHRWDRGTTSTYNGEDDHVRPNDY